MRILFFILLLSCSNVYEESSFHKRIIDDNNIMNVSDPVELDYFKNIFHLYIGENRIGTAFTLNSNPFLITNAHVAISIKYCDYLFNIQCNNIFAVNNSQKIQVSNIDFFDKNLDIAVLNTNSTFSKLHNIKISNNTLSTNDSIVLYSFNQEKPSKSLGTILDINDDISFKPSIYYNADSIPGMSGSPIFNSNREFIGIHWGYNKESKLNAAIPIQNILNKYSNHKAFLL